ncbi:MAG TPA: hypothetical protein VM536_12140 [Chloroflexia bacterium]|nr:hypothetical protein [Chloroflexia bacterium]
MHGYRRFLPLSVAIGVILLGAWLLVPRPPAPPVAGLPAGFAQHWLAGTPCRPPCWEGVTPGQTTVREALRILRNDSGIQPRSVVTQEDSLYNWAWGYIRWNWIDGQPGGEAEYRMGAADPVIDAINPYLPGSVTLQQVIDRYGQPTHIRARGGYGVEGQGPAYGLTVIYDSYGVELEAPSGWRRKLELSPQTAFDRVRFYAPPREPSRWAQPWRGMLSFEAYCVNDRTLKGPCPDVPLVPPAVFLLGLDGLLGLAVVGGLSSREGKGPLRKPMSGLVLGLLLAISAMMAPATCFMLLLGW